MDPLSFTASLIAVTTLAAQVSGAFGKLRDVCRNLPGRLHALNNEVSDLTAVLNDVGALFSDPERLRITDQHREVSIPKTLAHIRAKLGELKNIVEALTAACSRSKISLVKARAWSKVQGRLQLLQEEIKTSKSDLNVILGASNSQDLLHIRLDVQAISAKTATSSKVQGEFQQTLISGIADSHNSLTKSISAVSYHVDERLARLERIMNAQEERLYKSQAGQLRPDERDDATFHRTRTAKAPSPTKPSFATRGDAVGVRLRRYNATCDPRCSCKCHAQSRTASPELMNRVLGQLFIGYSGIPFIRPKCDDDHCRKRFVPYVDLEYWFPTGVFWSQIVRFQCSYQAHLGPQFSLSTVRRIPDNAQAVTFALGGNIDGLKHLFNRGLASPRDVSQGRGYSLIRWALYGNHYETCTFLLREGADPDHGPPTLYKDRFYNSARNRAHSLMLLGAIPAHSQDAYRELTRDDDWDDEQEFTLLHKAILGLSMTSVEDAYLQSPWDIDRTDAGGRTPLAWAAGRGDERTVALLLGYGADPNVTEAHGTASLYLAAEKGSANCCRLLLEAGAKTDPEKPKGSKASSALVSVVTDTNNPMALKTLLDFGADTESCGSDGKTSLIHAARADKVELALLLLEYGANINATTIAGDTPLTTAVTNNSHHVLKLLLDRWFEYSECPRLSGPHLLSLVAKYADGQTMSLLASTDHLRLKYDRTYVNQEFADQLLERFDASEELSQAFQGLLTVINEESTVRYSPEALMESGLRQRKRVWSKDAKDEDPPAYSGAEKEVPEYDEPEDEAFEDALEGLEASAT